jgi:hypothetical protein
MGFFAPVLEVLLCELLTSSIQDQRLLFLGCKHCSSPESYSRKGNVGETQGGIYHRAFQNYLQALSL